MGHLFSRSHFKLFVWFVLIPALAGCGKTAAVNPSIGVLSAVQTDTVVTAGSSPIAQEQASGYETGLKAASLTFAPKNINETTPQGDIQRTIRDLVESPQAPLLAVLGATSNTATSHAASLVNFFNLPMLVPSASGDNLFPSNNLWAFRLSAPGAAYAQYLFGSVLTQQALGAGPAAANDPLALVPELKVAILYEQNTFGESAAVATATAAMGQSFKVGVYRNFRPDNPDPASLKDLVTQVNKKGVQLVYLIASDPAVARSLVQTFRSTFTAQTMPILVGQAGGFAALDFLSSPEAEGVYVMRQKIDRTSCPAGVKSMYDAQSYAAVYLLDQAVQQARTNLAGTGSSFSLLGRAAPTPLQQREAIRDVLKQANLDLPCLGKVAFDNAGQNKLLRLELVNVKKGQSVASSPTEFLDLLKKRLASEVLQ